MNPTAPRLVLGITGASGAIYAVRLLEVLLSAGSEVLLSISPAGATVIEQELGLKTDLDDFHLESLLPQAERRAAAPQFEVLRRLLDPAPSDSGAPQPAPPIRGRVRYFHYLDFMAPIASGSSLTGGMVVCPCSGGTMSAIAHAAADNLIQRAADVHLKEGRKLVLVPRETPLSVLQLDAMRRCAEAGAIVLPAMPGFYHQVRSIRDLIDFVVARICDQLGVEHALVRRWGQ